VPVVANISDFYSDLYEKFRMPFPSIGVPIIKGLEKLAARRSRILIVDTEPQRRKWVSLGAHPSKCIILGHGIPEYETPPTNEAKKLRSSLGFPENSRVIFYIGDISELDGVDVLINAMPQILESLPETRVLIIGSGPRSYMKDLKELSDTLGVSNSITFIERIPHGHITKYGSVASVCVAPFRLTPTSSTSFPNKILEYLALGKPIVSSLGEGVSSVMGETISYARPGDCESLANSILACLQQTPSSTPNNIDRKMSWDYIVGREFELICGLTGHLDRDLNQ
jgi:glycosyltransferase involved in cell wall biosynthesis